jgi:ankyrin repeat protein
MWNPINKSFIESCEQNDLKRVLYYLNHNIDVDIRLELDYTPLIIAAQFGYTDLVTLLLTHGANIEANEITGMTSLMYATQGGYKDIVQILLQHKAEIERQDIYQDGNALIRACYFHHLEIISLLLDHGANIETRNANGETPLIAASVAGHLDTVSLLLDRGAEVNARNNDGKTALMITQSAEIISLLSKYDRWTQRRNLVIFLSRPESPGHLNDSVIVFDLLGREILQFL